VALNKKLVLELAWILPSVAIPIALLVAIVLTGFGIHITVPDDEGIIDVTAIDQTEPFNEPGVFEVEPGRYQVVMIASTFLFDPTEITIPAGSEVEFYITSRDVLHGFHVEDTNANVMLIPGRVSRVETTFEDPGEYRFVCHEYCGAGHHLMYGTVIVEEAS
jgi:cytochrome c oxidase subunit II